MTSSNSCELRLLQGGRVIASVASSPLEGRRHAVGDTPLDGQQSIRLEVRRPIGSDTRMRVMLGSEVLLVIPPHQDHASALVEQLRNEWGEATVVLLEGLADSEPDGNCGIL